MLLAIILALHILLAVSVSIGFIYRYILAFKAKHYPLTGRKTLYTGALGLVITGIALAIIGKLPITSLCLDSLGIISALIIMEVGLQKLANKLAAEQNLIDNK